MVGMIKMPKLNCFDKETTDKIFKVLEEVNKTRKAHPYRVHRLRQPEDKSLKDYVAIKRLSRINIKNKTQY